MWSVPMLTVLLTPFPSGPLGPPVWYPALVVTLLCTLGVWGLVMWLYKSKILNSHVMLYTLLFIPETLIPNSG